MKRNSLRVGMRYAGEAITLTMGIRYGSPCRCAAQPDSQAHVSPSGGTCDSTLNPKKQYRMRDAWQERSHAVFFCIRQATPRSVDWLFSPSLLYWYPKEREPMDCQKVGFVSEKRKWWGNLAHRLCLQSLVCDTLYLRVCEKSGTRILVAGFEAEKKSCVSVPVSVTEGKLFDSQVEGIICWTMHHFWRVIQR